MTKPQQLYVDLIKKTLSFSLWAEPPYPIELAYSGRFGRMIMSVVGGFFRLFRLRLMVSRKTTEEQRAGGELWPPGYADSMIGTKRLDNLHYCVETVLSQNIPGDFIETGVWRGGACIFMKAILAASGVKDRKVFVADSFQGLPEPDAEKYPLDKGDTHHLFDSVLAVSDAQVRRNFEKYGLWDDSVVFLKGWFKDTLPTAPIKQLAILRLDGDMYSSTIEVLETLYPKLSKGGFCIIDDYALAGCRKAVDDYRAKNGITTPIETIDWTGRWWRKE